MDKQLGGEPVWLTTVAQLVLAALVAWNVGDLTNEQSGLFLAVVAALVAVYRAWVTRDTLVAVGVGAVQAIVALAAAYEYNLTDNQLAVVVSIVTTVLGWVQAKRTEPLENPTFARGALAGPRYDPGSRQG